VNAMAAIDAFEIKSLNLASINGSSSTAKKSAGLMVTVQQILTARLKALSGRRSSNLTPGPTLNAEPRGKIAGFNTKLDLVFIDTGLFGSNARYHVRDVPIRIPAVARNHAPPGTSIVRAERMSPAFVKYHLDDGRVLHRFVRPEPHADPHDHPWSFETTILSGGYIEEVFTFQPDGAWRSAFVDRHPHSRHWIDASHIHRIVALPLGESWTLVRAGPHERKTMFWRFGDTVQQRAWNARRWSHYR
jgi:hypothetical protein